MSLQWSGEQVIAKFPDVQASAMAVDCMGAWVALAGRRAISMVNLRKPKEKAIKSTRQSKWDVSCIQWNYLPSHQHLFVTAYNQKLDLHSWKDSNISHLCSMKGHSRTVSDVNWSPSEPNKILSCSVDTFINLWDVNDPRKPVRSFQTVSGAYQVKWNKLSENVFATTHEGELRIWDTREGSSPVQYIAAHLSKIHGLDWNPNSKSELATCSQDCSVKFWDIYNPRQCKGSLNPGSPVWRARYTPFGQGIVTVVVPQLRRGDNSLHLWNTSRSNPVHQFVGHQDVILEFQWRKQQEGSKDHQLVTWSKDQSLRIWKIDPQLQKRCGHDMGDLNDSSENESIAGGKESMSQNSNEHDLDVDQGSRDFQRQMSLSPDSVIFQQPQTLQQEFDLMNTNIPNVQVEEMDAARRTCLVSAMSRNFSIGLRMQFPENYPYSEPPTFEFIEPNLNSDIKRQLHKVLLDTALMHAKRNTSCLEPCLRQLSLALNQPYNFRPEERKTPDTEAIRPFNLNWLSGKPQYMPWASNAGLQDSNIPFPRTSGARFSAAGYLVVFGRSHEARKGPSGTEITPKALCELTDLKKPRSRYPPKLYSFHQNYSISPPTPVAENVSISEWYMYRPKVANQPKGKRKHRPKEVQEIKPVLAPVKIYDSSCLLPIQRELGKNYIIDRSNIPAMCSHNAKAASAVGRRDLVQLWSLVAITASEKLKPKENPDDGSPWAQHPFGKDMIKYLFDFYMKIHDVQTLAMLVCVFWNRENAIINPPKKDRALPQSTSMDYVPPCIDSPDFLSSSTDSGWPLTGHLQVHSARPPPHTSVQSRPSQHHLSEVSSHPDLANMTVGVLKIRRSNSLSCLEDSFEDYRIEDEEGIKEKESERLAKTHENNCRLLDPNAQNQYDVFLMSYANILYHWGYTNNSKLVLKFMTHLPEPHTGIEFGVRCYHCFQEGRGAKCGSCKNLAFNCSICHIGVKGNSIFCLRCGHGGHTTHIRDWFKDNAVCPTGCSCRCVEAKSEISM